MVFYYNLIRSDFRYLVNPHLCYTNIYLYPVLINLSEIFCILKLWHLCYHEQWWLICCHENRMQRLDVYYSSNESISFQNSFRVTNVLTNSYIISKSCNSRCIYFGYWILTSKYLLHDRPIKCNYKVRDIYNNNILSY